jgi:hypothetical protein
LSLVDYCCISSLVSPFFEVGVIGYVSIIAD